MAANARVVELRCLEFRTRAVADFTGFLSVWYAAATRTIGSTTRGADDRALQVINLAGLGREVPPGRRAAVASAADCRVRRRGDVVRPDPDVRSLVGADRPGRCASHVVASRHMAGVAVCDVLRVSDPRERAALEGCTRRVNRVNHPAEVVAFLGLAIRTAAVT